MTQSIESMKETIATQAAVIEKLLEALIKCRAHIGDPANFDAYGTERELAEFLRQVKRDEDSAIEYADEAIAIPTDSTQILAEVRRAERERVAERAEAYAYMSQNFIALAEEIRAME